MRRKSETVASIKHAASHLVPFIVLPTCAKMPDKIAHHVPSRESTQRSLDKIALRLGNTERAEALWDSGNVRAVFAAAEVF
jgi:hypothetical protein